LLDAILYGNPSAKNCVETAALDLYAQRQGIPLHALLRGDAPGPALERLEMLHMLASGNLQAEREEAARLRAQGYRQWKIKVTGDLAADLPRLRAHCAELAGGVLSADANQSLSWEAALAIAQTGKAAGLSFLEQPFPAHDIDAAARLRRATGLALCADESLHGARDIDDLHSAGAAQGVSLKLIKLGGPRALVSAGRLCLSHGMKLNLACKVAETTISAAATAHAGFALPAVDWGFSMSNRYLRADVCDHPLQPRDGLIRLDMLQRPGLGFAPEPPQLREFASKDLPVKEFLHA
jgi:L-alanine-DL-glutamate epimerase-like enolase superfamily enzyme